MKRFLVLCMLVASFAIGANAQPGGQRDTTGQAQRMAEMRTRQKTGLIDQAKLTSEEADKVLDVYMTGRTGMRGLRDLSEDERKKKMDEMEADNEKKFKAIPLTDEKIKLVNDYMATQMRNRGQGGPGTQRPPQQ